MSSLTNITRTVPYSGFLQLKVETPYTFTKPAPWLWLYICNHVFKHKSYQPLKWTENVRNYFKNTLWVAKDID